MDRDNLKNMRFDRRLIRRPGWVKNEELEKELESLPDVSDKVAPTEGDEPEAKPPAE